MRKNLRFIYEPTGAAKEYADLALNIYNGCTHGCIYCYNNGRYSRKDGEFFKSSKPRQISLKDLAIDCSILRDKYGDEVPEILISFIGDAYQVAEASLGRTRLIVRALIASGMKFTILTKSDIIQRDFDILATHRDKFRLGMTILTTFEDEAQAWEPGAPSIIKRLKTLEKAKRECGMVTWVSLEPVMRVSSAVKLIKQWHHLVDMWHIGKLNHMAPPKPIPWLEAREYIRTALESVNANYIFKKSLKDL